MTSTRPVDGGDAAVEVVDELGVRDLEDGVGAARHRRPAVAGDAAGDDPGSPLLADPDAVLGAARDRAAEEQGARAGSPDPDRGAEVAGQQAALHGRLDVVDRHGGPGLAVVAGPGGADGQPFHAGARDGEAQRLAADGLEHDGRRVAVALDADGPVDDDRRAVGAGPDEDAVAVLGRGDGVVDLGEGRRIVRVHQQLAGRPAGWRRPLAGAASGRRGRRTAGPTGRAPLPPPTRPGPRRPHRQRAARARRPGTGTRPPPPATADAPRRTGPGRRPRPRGCGRSGPRRSRRRRPAAPPGRTRCGPAGRHRRSTPRVRAAGPRPSSRPPRRG